MINWLAVKAIAKSSKVWLLVGVLAITHTSAYFLGKANQRTAYEKERAEQAEKETKEVVDHVNTRLPVLQNKDAKAYESRLRIRELEEELQHAISQRSINPDCDLSDAEYDGWVRLAEEINAAAEGSNLQR